MSMLTLFVFCLLPLFTAERLSSKELQQVADLAGGCPYTTLADAPVKSGTSRSAKVQVCGEWKEVSRDDQRAETFAQIDWWSPSEEPMTKDEEQKIIDYTGHFWYSRNVGRLLKGVAPQLSREDPEGRWTATSRPALINEVLRFAVSMGSALNKLPTPDAPVDLYRGAWAPAEIKDYLMTKPQGFKVAWFQSTSSDESHTFMFFRPEFAPQWCQKKEGGCIEQGTNFPVHYTYQTTQAKSVIKWNAKESEHILLPNAAFNVISADKVMNDPLYDMTNEQLAQWFEKEHTLQGWAAKLWGAKTEGPWQSWADAVRASHPPVDGKAFSIKYFNEIIYGVQALLSVKDGSSSPYHALQNRFAALPADKGVSPDMNPYYYEVVLEDADALTGEEVSIESGKVHWTYYGACYWTDKCGIEVLKKTNAHVSRPIEELSLGGCPESFDPTFVYHARDGVCDTSF